MSLFSGALRIVTGKNVQETYDETMGELESLWRRQLAGLTFTEARIINTTDKGSRTDYLYPQPLPDGDLIVEKSPWNAPATLVRLHPDGTERELKQLSRLKLDPISAAGGRVVWSRLSCHPLWWGVSYSDIVIYDLASGDCRQLTRGGRFRSPSLSPDGRRIATVAFGSDGSCNIVILTADDGRELQRLRCPAEDGYLATPAWAPDGERLVLVRNRSQGATLCVANLTTATFQDLTPCAWEAVSRPVFCVDAVLYNSPYSGIDNIYAIDLRDGRRYQVTSRKFGAFNPAPAADGKHLYFNDYQADGHDVAVMPLDPAHWRALAEVEDRSLRYFEPLLAQEEGAGILNGEKIPDGAYKIQNFDGWSHLFNFHSWTGGASPETETSELNFYSTNLLNTVRTAVGARYNPNEQAVSGHAGVVYAGLPPLIDIEAAYGKRATKETVVTEMNGRREKEDVFYSWYETTVRFGLELPLLFQRGIYDSRLSLKTWQEYTRITDRDASLIDSFDNGNGSLLPLNHAVSYARFRQGALRDVRPRWGQSFDLEFRYTPFKGDYSGSLFAAVGRLYLPGFLGHHSLRLRGLYEEQDPTNYHFSSTFEFPRGYAFQFHRTLYKGAVDYALPLAYPELNLFSFLYVKRIKTNLFYDYGIGRGVRRGTGERFEHHFRSLGAELLFDFHPFSLPVIFDAGVRYAYLIDREVSIVEPTSLSIRFYF
jgi:hypothetical protein